LETAIVIPTYNEKKNIGLLIKEIFHYYKKANIFVVDDNSPDGTWKDIEKLSKKNKKIHLIKRFKKEGIGKAYIDGFNQVLKYRPKYIVQMDADFSHDPKVILEMLKEIKNKDIIIGSRYISGISVINWPLRRVLLSYFANAYVRLFTRMKICDITGGFKCFRREVLSSIKLNRIDSDGYSFQIEMNYICHRMKYRIKEIPIVFYDRHAGGSKMSYRIIAEALLRVPFLLFKRINKYRNQ